MSTIDEAMAQALAAEESANGDWVKDERYSTKEYYSDTDVSIDMERRTIGDISENVSTAGENNAQYISFMMDRYVDGVDLKDMTIQIQAEVSENVSAIDGPVNVYYNESKIRFGWAIPSNVAQQAATIEIIVFCTGALPDGNSYTIKTLPLRYTINDTLNIGGSIPQPDENWYLQFVTTMDEKVTAAANSASAARESATEVSESLAAAQDIQSDVNQSKSTVQTLTAQVQSNTTKAQASADVAKVSEQNAAKSEANAKMYADNASAVTGIEIAKKDRAGLVRGGDNYIAEDGTLHLTMQTDSTTLSNSYAGGIKLNELGGVSEQNTINGNQLFNASIGQVYSEATASISPDSRTITVSGIKAYAKMSTPVRTPLLDKIIGTTVTLSGKIVSKTVSNAVVTIQLVYTNGDGTKVYNGVISDKATPVAIPSHAISVTVDLLVNNNANSLSTTNTVVFEDIMLNAGSVALPWESFTGGVASPNPDYPQEIKSVVVSEVETVGKNFLKYKKFSGSSKGITVTGDEDMSVTVNGVSTDRAQFQLCSILLKAGTYVLSQGIVSNGNTACIVGAYVDENGNSKYVDLFTDADGMRSFTLTQETAFAVKVDVRNANMSISNVTLYPMLEDGTVATEYEPYQSSSITLSSPITLHGIGDVKDRIVRKDGVWGVERNIGTTDLTGAEWRKNATNNYFTTKDAYKYKIESYEVLCTKLIAGKDSTNAIFINSSGIIRAKIATEADTVEAVAEALNGAILYAPLATPTFEPFPTADQIALNSLVSFDGVTYLYFDSEIEPTSLVEYGTSRVGGYTLECYNDKEIMKLEIAAMKTAQTEEVVE